MLISIKPPTAWIGHSPCMLNRQNGALDQTAANDSASALAAKLDFLSRPESYIQRPQAVVARETTHATSTGNAHALLSRPGATVADARRRPQCRLPLSRSPLPRLRYPPDRRARHRAAAKDHAHPRARTLHAMPGLFAGSRLSLQAQPSGRAADDENISDGPAINLVARRTMIHQLKIAQAQ